MLKSAQIFDVFEYYSYTPEELKGDMKSRFRLQAADCERLCKLRPVEGRPAVTLCSQVQRSA